jgi:catechol 2,3-dioxygenase-like lactoylglutathione lyase family enzyme
MAHETHGIFDCRPLLSVRDMARSLAFYRNLLGFTVGWRWSDNAGEFLSDGDDSTPPLPTRRWSGATAFSSSLAPKAHPEPGCIWTLPPQVSSTVSTKNGEGGVSRFPSRPPFDPGVCTRCGSSIPTATRFACQHRHPSAAPSNKAL